MYLYLKAWRSRSYKRQVACILYTPPHVGLGAISVKSPASRLRTSPMGTLAYPNSILNPSTSAFSIASRSSLFVNHAGVRGRVRGQWIASQGMGARLQQPGLHGMLAPWALPHDTSRDSTPDPKSAACVVGS